MGSVCYVLPVVMDLDLGKQMNHALGYAQRGFIAQKVVQILTNVRVAAQATFVQRAAPSLSRSASDIFICIPNKASTYRCTWIS